MAALLCLLLLPLANEFFTLIKDTSLAAVIGFDELFRQGQLLVATSQRAFEVYAAVTLVDLLLTSMAGCVLRELEQRLHARGLKRLPHPGAERRRPWPRGPHKTGVLRPQPAAPR